MARREQRERTMLPVKIHGSNARGHPFTEMACITDISQNGARLEGAQCVTSVNEVITLERQGHKVQFRVVWIGEAGTRQAGCAGLQTLKPQVSMFGMDLPAPSSDSFDPTVPHGSSKHTSGIVDRRVVERRQQAERRRFPRYKCTGSAELRMKGLNFVTWGKVADICQGGCYVELTSPMPVDTALEVTVNVCDEKVRTPGVVRSNHPGVGIGIQFVDLAPDQAAVLAGILKRLAGGTPPPKQKVVPPPAPAARPAASPAAALEPVVAWFRTHETLTRADFLRLIEQKKPDDQKIA